jgi:hypothetical protein
MEPILLLVPTQNMADMVKMIMRETNQSFTVEIGANKVAVDIVQRYPDIDVIISRGGTVKDLKQAFPNKSIVEITATMYDLMPPMHQIASKGIKKIGILAMPNFIDDEVQDSRIGDLEIFMRPFQKVADILPTIKQLSQKGVQGIIGDKTVAEEARTLGVTSELIESGSISLKKAISEAIRVVRAQEVANKRNREKAEQIQRRVSEINDALERAVAAVEELSASSQELASISQGAANIGVVASQEVKNTADILNIIRRVADQTNLLGLNAAIEAARAGDLGRGFSVVAKEVRNLAEESNKSVSNIGTMLNQFRNSVERVLTNVEQCNVITQEQAGATQEIAQMLDSLRMVSQRLVEMAEEKNDLCLVV